MKLWVNDENPPGSLPPGKTTVTSGLLAIDNSLSPVGVSLLPGSCVTPVTHRRRFSRDNSELSIAEQRKPFLMNKISLIVACALALVAHTADARPVDDSKVAGGAKPSLGGLSAELTQAAAALPALNITMSETTEANVSLEKEGRVYLDDQKQKLAAHAAAEKYQLDNVYGPKKRSYDTTLATYTARCIGKPMPPPEFAACNTDKGRLDTTKAETDAWWSQYSAKWNAENTDPINAVIKRQNARIAEIDVQVKKNFDAFTAAQERSIALRKRIAEIEATFRAACSTKPGAGNAFTASETLKWCHSVSWDGAKTKLAPMYTYQGTGGASPN
jgi:hypothetical protein